MNIRGNGLVLRKHKPLKYLALVIALGIFLASCSSSSDDVSPAPSTATTQPSQTNFLRVGLKNIDSCTTLLSYFKTEALKLIGPYGLNSYDFGRDDFAVGTAENQVRRSTSLDGSVEDASIASGGSFSDTNVQVVGVDEPDVVKTDGQRIVGISSGELWIVDTTLTPAEKTGSLILGSEYGSFELFLYGDKIIVVGTSYGEITFANPRLPNSSPIIRPTNSGHTNIMEIDISATPTIVNELIVEGRYLSARRVGSTVNLVMESLKTSNLGFVYPSSNTAEVLAETINKQVIRDTVIADWVPAFYFAGENSQEASEGLVSNCEDVLVPNQFAGLDMISVLTLNLEENLSNRSAASVVTSGNTVYSSGPNLYVAHQLYDYPSFRFASGIGEEETEEEAEEEFREEVWIHKFQTLQGQAAQYLASGSVEGRILNQFSMHEAPDKTFWIVTTKTESTNIDPDIEPNTEPGTELTIVPSNNFTRESFITSFAQQNETLVQIASIGKIGKDENVHSVRFVEDTAYVVTFLRIDPFYVIDLRTPASPRIVGELKIPGFSSYLHPLGNDQLLGVGRSATDEGFVTGAKLSLFDASDPSDPQETAVLELGGGYTDVAWDYKAFLYWAPAERLFLPYNSYSDNFYGALVIGVDPDNSLSPLRDVGRFEHQRTTQNNCEDKPIILEDEDGESTSSSASSSSASSTRDCFYESPEQIRRSIVIGDTLWTLSQNFLEARDVLDLGIISSIKVTQDRDLNDN